MILKLECYIDGSSLGNPGPSGVGVYIPNILELALYIGYCTNNQAEMTALLVALKEIEKLKFRSCIIYTDSELVAYKKIKDSKLSSLRNQIDRHMNSIANLKIEWIDREQNEIADNLAREAAKNINYIKIRKE